LPITIQPYRQEHEPAVAAFNRRLAAAGVDENLVFYTRSTPRWLPKTEGSDVYNEFFVALDGDTVRGGYALKTQNFLLPDGTTRPIGYYHHVLSEGIVNKAYAAAGGLLLRDAMLRSPLLYCLGMGGYDHPLPKMLIGLGWNHCPVPFFFRIVHPSRFLSEMQTLRTSAARRLLMNLVAVTGSGWAAGKTYLAFRRLKSPHIAPHTMQVVGEFGDEVDALWLQARSAYSFTAIRDARTLRVFYPATDQHFTRLTVSRGGSLLGWAVVGERRRDAKYGSMRVGSILDCWALPGEELAVARSATQVLEQQRFDLILSNQSHQSWRRAFKDYGYLSAESNFIFAASKNLVKMLDPFDETKLRMHFTRADGDGLPRNF
jgi:hypothetical protein